jgi:alkylated DNA repair dioxygenase AlkB
MGKMETVEFDANVSPKKAMEAVLNRGACAIHNFISIEDAQEAATLLQTQPMRLDENTSGRVKRRQHLNAYTFDGDDTPASLRVLASEVSDFVERGEFLWDPNEIIAHRYEKNDFIGRHRDYTEAYGLVAVLTLGGLQDFHVELDGEEEPTEVTMEPGTLTMLRGFTGNPEDRPYHWVSPPVKQRTAISIRDKRSVWTTGPNDWA